jgi:hypothetical protein
VLIDLFCRDGKDIQYFNHNFHKCVRHFRGPRDLDIDLQSSKDIFYALEEASEKISTRANSPSGLRDGTYQQPEKGYQWEYSLREGRLCPYISPQRVGMPPKNEDQATDSGPATPNRSRRTGPTLPLMVAENALRTLIVGFSHVNDSSPLF